MKVVFWNGVSISDDVTNYMAAIGIILSSEFHCEVVLGSNYISNHMLQDCFLSKMKEDGIAHVPYCFLYDSSEYSNALWNMRKNRQGNILERPSERVTILFPPDVGEKKIFSYEVSEGTFYLLGIAGENYLSFQNVLDEADIIIVFLPQAEIEIQKFFCRFSAVIPKAIFVLEENIRGNRSFYYNILAKYGIIRENIGCISENNEFKEACIEGKLEDFIKDNRSTKSLQYSFLFGIRRIARLLYERNNKGKGV